MVRSGIVLRNDKTDSSVIDSVATAGDSASARRDGHSTPVISSARPAHAAAAMASRVRMSAFSRSDAPASP